MNDLLKQISSYNLFNYLLPGATFSILAEQATTADVTVEPIFAAFFFYYFVGMIISRVGSLVIEPLSRKTGFVTFAPYGEFIAASKKDQKIELISETNNVYRSITAVGICLIIYIVGFNISELMHLSTVVRYLVLGMAISVLFAFSYRKQTSYVKKRIAANSSLNHHSS